MADVAHNNSGVMAALASSGAARADSGTQEISVDRDLIVIIPPGFTTSMEEHFAALDRIIKQQRLRYPALRGLVDLSAVSVQSGAVLADIKTKSHQMWGPRDRVAIVVTGVLLTRQINRVAEGTDYRLFDSIEPARAWLGIA